MTQTVQRRNLVKNPADQGILSLQGPADSPVSPKMLQSAASVVFASLPGSGEACFHRSGDCQTAARYLDADWQEGCRFAPASPAEYVGHSQSLPAGFVLHHDEQPKGGCGYRVRPRFQCQLTEVSDPKSLYLPRSADCHHTRLRSSATHTARWRSM